MEIYTCSSLRRSSNRFADYIHHFPLLTLGLMLAATAIGCVHVPKTHDEAAAAKLVSPAGQFEKKGCNTRDRQLAINPKNHEFTQQVNDCANSSWGGAQATADCLRQVYPGLSESCSLCFGQEANCAVRRCVFPCIFSRGSDACAKCVRYNCSEKQKNGEFSLSTCTGLTVDQMPPRK